MTREFIATHGARHAIQLARSIKSRKRALSRRVPSSTWFDAAWHDRAQFPPPWDHPRQRDRRHEPPASAMTICTVCGRDTPPNCIGSSGACDDCRYGAMTGAELAALPPSPGIIDMGRLKKNARAGRQY